MVNQSGRAINFSLRVETVPTSSQSVIFAQAAQP